MYDTSSAVGFMNARGRTCANVKVVCKQIA